MGYPIIQYNSKTITFTQSIYRIQLDSPRQVIRNVSATGFQETLNVRADVTVDLAFRWFKNSVATDATLKRNLQQWSVWAQEGRAWNFGLDSANVVNTVLTANAAAGASVLSLSSMSGVAVDGLYVLRNALSLELVKVTALNTPGAGQVTLAETLNFSYFTGDRFRAEWFWPARLLSNDNPLIERPPLWYDVEMRFAEDVNSL
jgi:hypothetical protein